MLTIDLSKLTRHKVTMLTGHPRGLEARTMYALDAIDGADETAVIVAPVELDTITPSFVQGFLAASLRHLGEENLRRKYDVSHLPSFLQEDFETGLQRLLLHLRAKNKVVH
ncbi:hypothetical protein E7681_17735 [Thalassobius vesicularis]|uniref:DUF4325 domain-containing protein n=1 Tax=Thalassobius vesicularis TaxID=1294297 RepID=A0A4S3M5Y7_9RHOB|nr:hypothetical protein [Thalassobius vesicularis]THD71641.1 hypothetical protein E7681_17735 [Thalassobius vesicularis]